MTTKQRNIISNNDLIFWIDNDLIVKKEKDLKKCPFCGAQPTLKQTKINTLKIECRCGVNVEQSVLRLSINWLLDGMFNSWNKRV